MVKEPQGVLELMEQTEAAWRAEMTACDDVTAPERESLLEDLGALRREYADADYPRREAIQGDLRELIRRYDALSGTGSEPQAPHAPVPLGVEAAMPAGPEARPEPTRSAAPAAPEAAKPPKAPAPGSGTRRPEGRPRATGPVPHGYPGPTPGPEQPAETAGPEAAEDRMAASADRPAHEGGRDRDQYRDDVRDDVRRENRDDAEPTQGWQGMWGSARTTACRWAVLGRLAVEREVLLRKRETRFAELGVRLWQLGRRDGLEGAAGDGGVRERLRQVEQVDAAIRANRDRWDDLRGPG